MGLVDMVGHLGIPAEQIVGTALVSTLFYGTVGIAMRGGVMGSSLQTIVGALLW